MIYSVTVMLHTVMKLFIIYQGMVLSKDGQKRGAQEKGRVVLLIGSFL